MNQHLHYEVIGAPRFGTLICFPGNKKTRKNGLIKQVQDAFADNWRVVICTDLGVETDETEASLYDAATDFVSQIEREMPGLGVVLLGINRGARIALQVAQRVPQIVNAVAAIGRLIEQPRAIKKLTKNLPTELPQLWIPALKDGGTLAKVQEFLNLACAEFPAATPWIEASLAQNLQENPPILNPTVQEQRENGVRLHPITTLPSGFVEKNVQIPVEIPACFENSANYGELIQKDDFGAEILARVISRELNSASVTSSVSSVADAVIFLVHGGGYVAGSAFFESDRAVDMIQDFGEFLVKDHSALQLKARNSANISVVVPEYRLAPEYPHPIAREDVLAALRWVFSAYVDVPVIIYADSAGVSLAYQALLQLPHEQLQKIAGMVALEPCLDPQMNTASSYNYHWGPTWNRAVAEQDWEHYRQKTTMAREIFPPIATELDTAFPPVLAILNPADMLRDEGTSWVYRLIDVGVRAQLVTMPGTYHGALATVGTKTWELGKRAMRPFIADCLDNFQLNN